VQAICTMVAIAMVHSASRTATGIALGLFSTGVAVSILLIAAHNRPFTGELSVQPDILQQVLPGP
jgi:multisubunit Na+/H+ antiporter MnhC subunit